MMTGLRVEIRPTQARSLQPLPNHQKTHGRAPTILFVDDEENVLKGLRRFMRTRRKAWNSLFVGSGAEAVALLGDMDVDLVVTDMRMPNIDGAGLLEWISQNRPGIVRIVLSGEANIEETYRTIGRSHRFLSKPCTPETLISTIEQIFEAHWAEEMNLGGTNASFLDLLTTPVDVYSNLEQELAKPDTTPEAVAGIIETDPGLAARVLQLVNSAYFCRPLATASIERSVSAIGLDHIRALFERERLGQAAQGDHPVPGNVDFGAFAAAARAYGSRLTENKEILDTIYTVALFIGFGRGSSGGNAASSTATAKFTATLLGLPQLLIDALWALQDAAPERGDSRLAERICDCVFAKSMEQAT